MQNFSPYLICDLRPLTCFHPITYALNKKNKFQIILFVFIASKSIKFETEKYVEYSNSSLKGYQILFVRKILCYQTSKVLRFSFHEKLFTNPVHTFEHSTFLVLKRLLSNTILIWLRVERQLHIIIKCKCPSTQQKDTNCANISFVITHVFALN